MAVRTRTRAELATMLDDLVDRMTSAGERFDEGNLLEARGLAGHIATLLHRSDGSRALIDQLESSDHLTWVDTAGVPNPNNSLPRACLTLMVIRTGPKCHGQYVPKMAMYPPAPIRTRDGGQIERGSRIPFDHWWTNPVLRDTDGRDYSRKQLVLALANHDAAGQNPEMKAASDALIKSRSFGWVFSGRTASAAGGFERNPVMASVRQIGYEVIQSIMQQRDLIGASTAA